MFKSYGKAISNCFKFSGRTRRKDLWGFIIVNAIITGIIGALTTALGTPQVVEIAGQQMQQIVAPGWLSAISSLYSLIFLISSLSITFRRLHDTGKSGAYLFWYLLPIIGSLMIFFRVCFRKGDVGVNKYGEDPKAAIVPAA